MLNNVFHPFLYLISKILANSVHLYFCFVDYAKAFDCVDQNKLWKI